MLCVNACMCESVCVYEYMYVLYVNACMCESVFVCMSICMCCV